jgi:hypothetical protein
MSDRQRFILLTTVAAAVVVVGGLALVGCSDDSGPEAASTTPTTIAATTTAAPAEPASATEVARGFVDAYGEFDADEALSYLTEDAIRTGAGNAGSWGSEDAFRLETAVSEAQAIEQTITGCEEQGESAAGTSVHCAFDVHGFHSDEIGRGPYTDNYWDLVVRDGKIDSAVSMWGAFTNGFSAEMWAPFQTWVGSTHPGDLAAMYLGGSAVVSEESVRLWEQHLREWADTQPASSQ